MRSVELFQSLNNPKLPMGRTYAVGYRTMVANHRPTLNGERFLTDKEVSARLKVSRRTLQEWRTNGQIAYISLGGKVLYKEPEIQKMLEKYHQKAWQ